MESQLSITTPLLRNPVIRHLMFAIVLAPLTAWTADDEIKFYERPIVVTTPSSSEYKVFRDMDYRGLNDGRTAADIYVPKNTEMKYPAVFFVHGGPLLDKYPGAKSWTSFESYGALMTKAGLAGIVFNHRFNSLDNLQTAANDIKAAVEYVRANSDTYSIDKDRICVWFYSGAGHFVAPFLSEQPKWLKCMAIYYAVFDPSYWATYGMEAAESQTVGLDPYPLLATKNDWDPAFLIVEAGADNAELNAGLQKFSQIAIKNGWNMEYWNHPTGPHGFDVKKRDQRSRRIIFRSIEFVREQLVEESTD